MKKTIILAALTVALATLWGCTPAPAAGSVPPSAPPAVSSAPAIKDVALKDLQADVSKAYGENYIPSMAFTEEEIAQKFGVKKELYDEALVEGPMISVQIDTFAAFKAKEGKAAEIETALNAYRDTLVNDTMQYPMNLTKIQASRVVKHGNYVFFLMLGAPNDTATDEAVLIKHFEEQNDIAEKAIKAALGVE